MLLVFPYIFKKIIGLFFLFTDFEKGLMEGFLLSWKVTLELGYAFKHRELGMRSHHPR